METIFVVAVLVSIAWWVRVRLWARGLVVDIICWYLGRASSAQMMIGLLATIKGLLNPRPAKPIAGNRQFPVMA
jgi:hypothetical protein